MFGSLFPSFTKVSCGQIAEIVPRVLQQCFVRSCRAVGRYRRTIELIECNAKCRHLKEFTCKGTLRQVFICLRPRSLYPPYTLKSVYVYTVNLFTHRRGGGGGRVEPERMGERQQFTKLGRKYQHD
jgi:hypothetical protein